MTNIIKRNTIDTIMKLIGDIEEGLNIMINDTWLQGVETIGIEYIPIDKTVPQEATDGREENYIILSFIFSEGKVTKSFCPEHETCEVWYEEDNLLAFRIQDTKTYIEQQRTWLEFMERDYNAYMEEGCNA